MPNLLVALGLLSCGRLLLWNSAAQGIPEPGLVMNGQVRNTVGGQTVLVTSGTLTWVFQPDDGGAVVTVATQLTNIHDQFSYVLEATG